MRVELTVAIPLYNNARNLPFALDSILNQTYPNYKILISDDCSTDDSYNIAMDYAKKDKRISVIRRDSNLGPIANWAEVAKNIDTPYFIWLTGDDVLHTEFFEKAIGMHETYPQAVLVYPRALFMSYDGVILPKGSVSANSDIDTNGLNVEDRLIKFVTKIHACTAIYGVFKSKYITTLPMHIRVHAFDVLWLFTAAIYGDILEIPTVLFYRRLRKHSETPQEIMERFIKWRLFVPNNYSPHVRLTIALLSN